jgi:chromate reductase
VLDCEIVEIGDLPLYNEDIEAAGAPASWTRFREEVRQSDAVLFVTPEYNRSVPAALKNAIDVGSRPYGNAVWTGKPAAIMSLSPGALGAFGANHHLRQSLVFFDMPLLQQPEAYVGDAFSLFDEASEFNSESTKAFFESFIGAFANWVDRTRVEPIAA